MRCKCGHWKKEHDYQRDYGRGSGACNHTERVNENTIRPCLCCQYEIPMESLIETFPTTKERN